MLFWTYPEYFFYQYVIICAIPVVFSLYGCSPNPLALSSARMSAPSAPPASPASLVPPSSPVSHPLTSLPSPSTPLPISQRYRPYSLSSSVPISPSPRSVPSGMLTPPTTSGIPSSPSPRHHTTQTSSMPVPFLPSSPSTVARRTALAARMPSRYLFSLIDVKLCHTKQSSQSRNLIEFVCIMTRFKRHWVFIEYARK